MQWPADYLLGCGAFSIFGSDYIFLIGMYAYISDITTTENRTMRIGIIDVVAFVGIISGTLLSGFIFKFSGYGYLGVFWTALVIQVFALTYIILFVKESRGPNTIICSPISEHSSIADRSTCSRYISILDISQIADVFKVTFKKRDFHLRSIILVLLAILTCNNIASNRYMYFSQFQINKICIHSRF